MVAAGDDETGYCNRDAASSRCTSVRGRWPHEHDHRRGKRHPDQQSLRVLCAEGRDDQQANDERAENRANRVRGVDGADQFPGITTTAT
jgi:hypothetical protein